MTREDIIRMTREAGMEFNQRMEEMHTPLCDGVHIEDIERFAALVAAAEREVCAKVLDEMAAQDKRSNYYQVAAAAIRARNQQ